MAGAEKVISRMEEISVSEWLKPHSNLWATNVLDSGFQDLLIVELFAM